MADKISLTDIEKSAAILSSESLPLELKNIVIIPPHAKEKSTVNESAIKYVVGPRKWAIGLVISFMFFVATMDMTIAATCLVAITNDLGDFERASWVLTSYFLGYVAVIVILAKLSDIFRRKTVTVASIVLFTLFSAGCAVAQSLTQLIILRAFHGVGGGGSFALCSVLLIKSEPPEKYADAVTRYGMAVVLGLVLGPLLGEVVSEHTTWRWIFLINIPVGLIALLIALFGIPNGFPYQGRQHRRQQKGFKMSLKIWGKMDFPGAILLLLATLSFTACFQEVGSRFSWRSAYVIALLVVSTVSWSLLMIWERCVTLANKVREPVLPWRLFTNRETAGLFLCVIFVGAPVSVTNFQLPQRFMLINGVSNFDSAVRIIPFGAASAFGTMLSGRLASKLKVLSIYLILVGAVLQAVGFALLSTLNAGRRMQPEVYPYQVLAGLGCSFSWSNLIMLTAFTAEKRDGAVALGAANQFRAMGFAIGLAVVISVFNAFVGSQLSQIGIADPLSNLAIQAQSTLAPVLQEEVRKILSDGYNRQMLTLCAFGFAQIPSALLMWKRKQIVVA